MQIDLAAHFSDPDGDPLAYAATPRDASVATATVAGAVVNIAAHSSGSTWVDVTARDPRNQRAGLEFLVVALTAPKIVREIPDVSLTVGDSAQFDLADHFLDSDGEPLTYTARAADSSVATAALHGNFLGIEAHSWGVTEISVTAVNSDDLSTTLTFTVNVSAPPEAVGEIEDLTLAPDASVRIDLAGKFSDPENDPLTYVAESAAPNIATASADGGVVTVVAREPGVTTVTVTASDLDDLSASLGFSVTVTATVRNFWGGWRSVLLRQPSVKTTDEP